MRRRQGCLYGSGPVDNFGDFCGQKLDTLFNKLLYEATPAARAKKLQHAEAPNPYMIDT